MNTHEFSQSVNKLFVNNLQRFATDMQIVYELQLAVAGNEHPICLGIKNCIKENLPVEIILTNIKEMAHTNKNAIADLIGLSLTEKIMSL
jgi:hypothetical protein